MFSSLLCTIVSDSQQSSTDHRDIGSTKQENAIDQGLFCSHCSRCFTEKTSFARHMRYHKQKFRTDVVVTYPCSQCGKTSNTKSDLRQHIKLVHERAVDEKDEKITCHECNKVLKKSTIKNHIQRIHRGKLKVEQCDICGSNYRGNLENHKKLVHFKQYAVFCEVCGKGFMFPGILKTHMARIHGEGESLLFPCTEEGCSKVFRGKDSLKYHLDAVHREGEYGCRYCGKTFAHPMTYKKHIRVHKNGPVRHSCTICKKLLASKESLHDHMRSHSGERPFVCEVCGRGFISIKHLKSHYVVHTKEKRFACQYCDKKYTQRGPLRRHIDLCHPEVAKEADKQKISGNDVDKDIGVERKGDGISDA